MAKAKIKVVLDNVSNVVKGLQNIAGQRVMVGIPETKTERKDDAGPTNAMIGYWNEFGAPEANIPARPHLIPGVKSVQKESIEMMREAAVFAMEGKPEKVNRQLNKIGLINQNAVRAKIRIGPFAPLAESTLAARRRRGRTGEKPLMDTGQYIRAQTYVIRKT